MNGRGERSVVLDTMFRTGSTIDCQHDNIVDYPMDSHKKLNHIIEFCTNDNPI